MGASWSVPYGSSEPAPYWGPQTSAVNFCEEDYIVTRYIGEFFNTVTSLVYVGYGVWAIRRKRRENVSAYDAINFPYWGLIGVGVCSALYHMTLKYHTQMSDELSMHLAMGTVLHRLFTFEQPLAVQRRNTAVILGVLVPFVIYHCVTDEFVLHVILFLGMSILVTVKTRLVIAERVADVAKRSRLTGLSTFGAGSALLGYLLWNVDVNFCPALTAWKRQLGLPWGALLELHGYWHILTGIGSYTLMAQIEYLTSTQRDSGDVVGFMWPVKAVFYELAASTSAKRTAKGGGSKAE